MSELTRTSPTVLVVGTGFAGFHALRRLERSLPPQVVQLSDIRPGDALMARVQGTNVFSDDR